jgi:uncharacterized membrane protein YbjE (DUF340 family)
MDAQTVRLLDTLEEAAYQLAQAQEYGEPSAVGALLRVLATAYQGATPSLRRAIRELLATLEIPVLALEMIEEPER